VEALDKLHVLIFQQQNIMGVMKFWYKNLVNIHII